MQIRDNVRRRRRERIMRLLDEQRPAGTAGETENGDEKGAPEPGAPERPSTAFMRERPENPVRGMIPGHGPGSASLPATAWQRDPEPDPEKWWKEQQQRLNRTGPVWRGAAGKAPAAEPPKLPEDGRFRLSRFAGGFAIRMAASAVIFAAAWAWFRSDLPGSREARDWTAVAVTRDMDFQAVEAWYERAFGGSPSFLPAFRGKGETRAVSGGWKRSDAVSPVDGRPVQTFAQDGSGVRIAAKGGSEVRAVYAGRVLQVGEEDGGKATVLLQHADNIVTVYGNLELPAVRAGDWVEAGQPLGSVPMPLDAGGESLLYFAVNQNGKAVDPAEVVPFD
jgi:stage IV sporulation protein FA